MGKWTYALLLIGSILIPLLRSFETRVRFYEKWKPLFIGILVMMLIFIPWDILFTRLNVWSFNPDYVTGIYIVNLPLEEWLFFIIIPYCCVFIYEVLLYFFPKFKFPVFSYWLTISLAIITFLLAVFNFGRLYTLVVMTLASIVLIWQVIFSTHKTWLSHFYLMYFISLIPFFIVNGVLTALPVVSYSDIDKLNILMFTIPLEDSMYLLVMLMMVIMIYEPLKERKSVK
jgi:lycopene cyclase domain-containing protein